jgi:hypothetical protein
MASLKNFVEKEWPGINVDAFWSLSERIENTFQMVSQTDDRVLYRYVPTDGKLLKAPFQALHSIRVDLESTHRIRLLLNDVCLETVQGSDFDTFGPESPFPFLAPDDLLLEISCIPGQFLPRTLGSARCLRFEWRNTDIPPFVITTTCSCAVMFDGHQIRAITNSDDASTASSVSTDIKDLLQDLTTDMTHHTLDDLFDAPCDIESLKKYVTNK